MMTFYDLLKTHEGAGDPDTLFGHSQRLGGQFGGTKVSEMNLGQLKEFSSPDGDYGQWVKDELGRIGHRPRVATPMGIGQIVGSTMRDVQAELGLGDDVMFDEKTQRMMINHLAGKRINLNDKQATLKGLRNEWEGFKHVDDEVLWNAAQNYSGANIDKSQLNTGKGRLFKFQQDMQEGSEKTREAIDRGFGIQPDQLDMGTEGGPSQLDLAKQAMGLQMGTPNEAVPTRFSSTSFGAGNPADYQTGTPETGTAGTSAEETIEENKQTLMDKIGAFIHPNAEDPGQQFKETLGALGVGLGQMSVGRAVDLQQYFGGIAQRKAALAKTAQDAQAQAMENYFKHENLKVAQRNAAVAEGKLERDLANDASQAAVDGASPFSIEQLTNFMNDPVTAGFVPMLTSPDEEARKQGLMGLKTVMQERGKAVLDEKPQLGELYKAVAGDATPTEIAEIMSRTGADANDLNAVFSATGKSPTTFMKNSEALQWAKENDPDLYDAMAENQRRTAGIEETPIQTENRKHYQKRSEEMDDQIWFNARINSELNQLENATLKMKDKEMSEGVFSGLVETIGSGIRQTLGQEAMADFQKEYGVDLQALQERDNAAATLALLIAKPMVQGQGTITDAERANLVKVVANENMTPEARLAVIGKLRVLNDIDAAFANAYEEGMNFEDYSNSRSLYSNLKRNAADIMPALTESAGFVNAYNNREGFETLEEAFDLPQSAIVQRAAPLMTEEQYRMYGKAIPTMNINGKDYKFHAIRGKDGSVTYYANGEKIKGM